MRDLTAKTDKFELAEFLDNENGLYISVIPTAAAVRNLQPIIDAIQSFGLTYTGMPNLHVTVLYSKTSVTDLDALYKGSEIDPSNFFVANILKFEYWEGHKNQGVLVLKLKCPQLEKVHYELREQGYKVSFPDYQPHMTFIDNLHEQGYKEKKAKQLVQILNGQLQAVNPRVELTGMKAEAVS